MRNPPATGDGEEIARKGARARGHRATQPVILEAPPYAVPSTPSSRPTLVKAAMA